MVKALHHIGITVASLEREYRRLKGAGIVLHSAPLAFFGSAKAACGRDPDGNLFELLELRRGGAG